MKKILVLFAWLFTQILFAQNTEGYGFAIIDDKDGFTNVREEPNLKSKIVGKINEGELFYCFSNEKHKDWFAVDFKGKNVTSGYVHKSRAKFLYEFSSLKHQETFNTFTVLKNDSIEIKITAGDFDTTEHIISRKNDFITLIDGKKPYGIDGDIPYTTIKSIEIKINEQYFEIPQNELDDLFHPSFVMSKVFFTQSGTIYLTMSNSDGAGGYEVAFVIQDRKFQQRYVFYGF